MTVPADGVLVQVLANTPVSRTCRVRWQGRDAVLRVDAPGARRLGLNRAAESGVLGAAEAAGLGPACLDVDLERGTLITEWLPGRAWSASDLREPGNLRRAAALLRRVHAVPLAAPVLDLAAAVDRYAGQGGARAVELAAVARQHLGRCLGGTAGSGVVSLCLCHSDPTPGNFIAGPDGDLRLIDWEYAGVCHAGFDLAGLAVGADLDLAQDEILLEAYWGRAPQSGELALHRRWRAFCDALGGLWTQALAQQDQRLTRGNGREP